MIEGNYYMGEFHALESGEDSLLGCLAQFPPLYGLSRREAKGQYVPVRGMRSGRVAGTSPECVVREPVLAGAAAATLLLKGEAQEGQAAKVLRAGMASKGSRFDRGKPRTVLWKGVAKGRMHKPEAMRCEGSDGPIVRAGQRAGREG